MPDARIDRRGKIDAKRIAGQCPRLHARVLQRAGLLTPSDLFVYPLIRFGRTVGWVKIAIAGKLMNLSSNRRSNAVDVPDEHYDVPVAIEWTKCNYLDPAPRSDVR